MDWSNIVEEYIDYIDDERDRTGAAHITLYGFPYIPENIIIPRIEGKYDDLIHLKYEKPVQLHKSPAKFLSRDYPDFSKLNFQKLGISRFFQ